MGERISLDDLTHRFTYHKPTTEQIDQYKTLRDKALEMAKYINYICPESREKSLAITKLEETVMWANASIARSET